MNTQNTQNTFGSVATIGISVAATCLGFPKLFPKMQLCKVQHVREETVAESAGGGTDASVPSARWQECEESMGWVRKVILNAGSYVGAKVVNIG